VNPRPPSPIDRAFLTDDPDVGHLLLVRHGQQQWPDSTSSTVNDWTDPPLSVLGHKQAAAVASYLDDHPVSAVYTSDLARAHDTGCAIAEKHGLTPSVHADLAEIKLFHHLDGDQRPVDVVGELTLEGVRERFVQTLSWDAYPFSESSLEFRRRVGNSIEGIIANHPGETVVVACHGGVINLVASMVFGTTVDFMFRPGHASVSWVRFGNGRRVVETLNDHSFLRSADLLTY